MTLYRGTEVAVKRVLPAEDFDNATSFLPLTSKLSLDFEKGRSTHLNLPSRELETGKSSHMSLPSQELEVGRSWHVSLPADSGSRHTTSNSMLKGRGLAKLRSDFISEMKIISKLRHPNITTVMVRLRNEASQPCC